MKNIKRRKRISFLLVCSLVIGLLSTTYPPISQAEADTTELANPVYTEGESIWDCVYFGNYWQNDNNGDGTANQSDTKEPIKWRVLWNDGETAFLLSDQVITTHPYKSEEMTDPDTQGGWANSDLRTYLNETFIDDAFTSEEQEAIVETMSCEDRVNNTDEIVPVMDKVYIPSAEEMSNPAYGFDSTADIDSKTRASVTSQYVAHSGTDMDRAGHWCRRPGHTYVAPYVTHWGYLETYGIRTNYSLLGTRPTIVLDLSSDLWTYAGTVSSNDPTEPTATPSMAPTIVPTVAPPTTPTATAQPSETICPTAIPDITPTSTPTENPTIAPTDAPNSTSTPTSSATPVPNITPVATPSAAPTIAPTDVPIIAAVKTSAPKTNAIQKPGKSKIKSVTNKKSKKLVVKLKKMSSVDGYQIQYALNKKFKSAKAVNTKKTTITVKKLKKKMYFVRARAYTLNGNKKVYGKWSATKKVKIKK